LKKKVIFIVGPTAVGKTRLSVAFAEKINGEIISADSMQAYRGMDIVSQAPSGSEQKKIRHHLVNFLDPREEYSAAIFSRKAEKAIRDILHMGKIPIVTGGSGLYVKALIDGIFPSKGKSESVREKLRDEASKKGVLFLHGKLKKLDPQSARKIHPNDLKRVVRALEIYELEKKTKSRLKTKTKGIKNRYDVVVFGLVMDRKRLYERIEKRVDFMFRKGLVKEAKRLLNRRLSATSKQALGVRHIAGYLLGEYTLETAKKILKRDTRRFAKKQLTWFRPDKRIRWLDLDRMHTGRAVQLMAEAVKDIR